MVFLQLFLNGLQLGAIYALTAVGFSLIFGSTKIFHVAHGSAFAISGYIYWWLASKLNVPWPLATLRGRVGSPSARQGLVGQRPVVRPHAPALSHGPAAQQTERVAVPQPLGIGSAVAEAAALRALSAED